MNAAGAERAVAALAASQHSALGRRQAASSGMSRKMVDARIRSGVFREPIRGVLVFTAAPKTWRQSLMVATLAGAEAVASHIASAALSALDGFEPGALDVSVLATRHLRAPGYTIHR